MIPQRLKSFRGKEFLKALKRRTHRLMFNRLVALLIIIIFLIAAAVKIDSSFSALDTPEDWNYHMLQGINRTQENFSFAVFGDNKNSVTTFNTLIDRVNRDNVSFGLDVGDLVFSGDMAKYRFFIDQMKKFQKPVFTVVGNHDIMDDGRTNYYELFGLFYYSFTVDSSYFIVLDDANEKNLDAWQMEWLRGELERSQNYTYRFVFMHVPLFDPREHGLKAAHSLSDLSFAFKLNKLFDDSNVTMLFCSHIHGYFHGVWGKTPYIITGGAGAELMGTDDEHYFYHYIRVSVSGGNVSYQVVKLPTPDDEFLDRWVHNIWIYTYAFFAIYFYESVMGLALFYLGAYVLSRRWEWVKRKIRAAAAEAKALLREFREEVKRHD